ncbi:Wzz/FepE/Etk N-terminal domain-containing protein [Metabacillus sp. GX 13764]|uniref:YveK family protein n=1 Tax=Metabacillus kandeliae TaxID=2900151 RepID=UPI001E473CE2|nr:Wzz/FepE/Etk N-terminal domain-containing protein [Metabacillus kandeliae]MCD7034594.1 Wzz/FepE/Etk N-terminal domain-containing protein [Metabacillus kandeliae]
MEETISLKELFQTLKKRLSLIILITALATATSGIVSYFFLTPVYEASTQILVNQSKNDQQMYEYNQVQTNVQLINTYSVIIKSAPILGKVKEQLKLPETLKTLTDKITVASEKESQIFSVTVEDESPARATKIANTIATVFQSEIKNLMNVDNVSILSPVDVADSQAPVKPRPALNMAIAFVVGLMAAVGLAFLLEYLDNTIKNEQDIERLLELPVLGSITQIKDDGQQNTQANQASMQRTRGETIGS